jgi:hypothetical protein
LLKKIIERDIEGVRRLLNVITKLAAAGSSTADVKLAPNEFSGSTQDIIIDDGYGGWLIRQNICLPLLHACIDRTIPNTASQAKAVVNEDNSRVLIAQLLLGCPAFALPIELQNIEGLSVLHLAARYGDLPMMSVLLSTDYDSLPARKGKGYLPFDVNEHCTQRGWTPLHYAAAGCHIDLCRLLLKYGGDSKLLSNIVPESTSSISSDQLTSLDIINSKLTAKPQHLSGAVVQGLNQLVTEMTKPVVKIAIGGSSSAAKSGTNAKPTTSKAKAPTEKELKEQEQAERKQKQAKEKQEKQEREREKEREKEKEKEKDREREKEREREREREREKEKEKEKVKQKEAKSESENKDSKKKSTANTATGGKGKASAPVVPAAPAAPEPAPVPAATVESSSSSPPPVSSDAEDNDAIVETPVKAAAEPAGATSSKKSKKKKDKGAAEKPAPMLNPTTVIPTIQQVEPVSRDELLDHLLAMGFPEADCLTALSVCGKDIDLAITWLCEHPPGTPAPAPAKSAPTAQPQSKPSAQQTPSKSTGGNSGSNSNNASKTPTPKTAAPPAVTTPAANTSAAADAAAKQKEKDLKEEMRRINRAWNAKAEDEKKKVRSDCCFPADLL